MSLPALTFFFFFCQKPRRSLKVRDLLFYTWTGRAHPTTDVTSDQFWPPSWLTWPQLFPRPPMGPPKNLIIQTMFQRSNSKVYKCKLKKKQKWRTSVCTHFWAQFATWGNVIKKQYLFCFPFPGSQREAIRSKQWSENPYQYSHR